MTNNALINQIATIILDVHSHLYTKDEAFDKIRDTLKQKDGGISYKRVLYQSHLLTASDSWQLEQDLNAFLSALNDQGHELDDVTYQSHLYTDSQGQAQQEYSVLVVYKRLT